MKCTVCKTENPNNAKFCAVCGSAMILSEASGVEAAEITTDTELHSDADSEIFFETKEIEASSPSKNFIGDSTVSMPELVSSPVLGGVSPFGSSYASGFNSSSFDSASDFTSVSDFDSHTKSSNKKENKSKYEHENKKQTRVISFWVAAVCIAAVFILAAVCGALFHLYISKGDFSKASLKNTSLSQSAEIV